VFGLLSREIEKRTTYFEKYSNKFVMQVFAVLFNAVRP